METGELKAIVEALIYVAEEPITEKQLLEALSDAQVTAGQLEEAVNSVRDCANKDASRGLQLSEVAGGYQFRTKESMATWIAKLNVPKPMRLSQPALETLAIVAYRQPIVRSEIEQIRGVDVGAVLKTLLERNLVRIIGRRDEPGQPLIYGTTREFLETFNLNNLHELPTLTDIQELARRQVETETPAQLTIVKSDEDEPTEVIEKEDDDEDGDEETEVIRHEEDEDEKALVKLEQGIKELRRLERDIFPKPPEKAAEEGNAQFSEAQAPASPAGEEPCDAAGQGTSPEVDRTDN